jgi:glycosyltransferase involved in cell wall biosynthesis
MTESSQHDASRIRIKEWVKKRVLRLCSSALAGGVSHADYLLRLGFSQERIFRGYDVVDNDFFMQEADRVRSNPEHFRASIELPARYFLAVGRLIEKKNVFKIIEAFSLAIQRQPDMDWHLVIVGDGPLRSSLIRKVGDSGISSRVRFFNFQKYNDLPVFYTLASVFIHASSAEQWGLVVNEAMASGLPIFLSSRCGCSPHLVESDVNGFLFDPKSADSLAELMVLASSGKLDLLGMGNASRKIISKWSPSYFAENLANAVRTAAREVRSKPTLVDLALLRMLTYL